MQQVALLAEGVDRNSAGKLAKLTIEQVALLAEGVDRNSLAEYAFAKHLPVALLAEGVDRNCTVVVVRGKVCCRPPRRGRG